MNKANNYFNKSNDNTFNLVIKNYCYKNKDKVKALLLIKHGGLVTSDSISKPQYKLFTITDYKHGKLIDTVEDIETALKSYQQRFEKIKDYQPIKIDNKQLKDLLIDFGLYNTMVRSNSMLKVLIKESNKALADIVENNYIIHQYPQFQDLVELIYKASNSLLKTESEQSVAKLVKMMYNKWYKMVKQFENTELPNTILPNVIANERQLISNVTSSLSILLNFIAV